MNKTLFAFLSFLLILSAVYAQKGTNFNRSYPGGGRLLMSVDSTAKNVYYGTTFPNLYNPSVSYRLFSFKQEIFSHTACAGKEDRGYSQNQRILTFSKEIL
ncbi:hypothetical protein [Sphingobacterium luzhongxinii]|uniref:hypothetical protein n=1 Tax=Sphingobacterium luzhongxinii TaxID=2654181 RepID=UPI0013D9A208|nr:hypothetical protein [Sphingobacterium sp. xlx-73]